MANKFFSFNFNILIAVVFSFIFFNTGCQKNSTERIDNVANILDSIISDSSSLHFIYDAEGRVIEDRYQVADTLMERNVYEYGNDSMPVKKRHYTRAATTPDYINEFLYNNNKQKIYDSSYSTLPGNSYYSIETIDYSNPGLITIYQWISVQYLRNDTIYLNSTGNIDSIRSYYTYNPATGGTSQYWYTEKCGQYIPMVNVFKSLTSSYCNFYGMSAGNGASFISNFYPVTDYFNSTCFTSLKMDINLSSYSGPYNDYQKQMHFNADNLPETETVNYTFYTGFSNTTDYRFVYKQ